MSVKFNESIPIIRVCVGRETNMCLTGSYPVKDEAEGIVYSAVVSELGSMENDDFFRENKEKRASEAYKNCAWTERTEGLCFMIMKLLSD
ncbi:hypothetical protein Lalb_Chr19g0138761 [Lupinus albus]|uniref:Uncharacterized protein n=1 Tax=Lupinus albus TaxID=3870 RepID=A0A6A4NMK3_LUPAL|nr:hypothetical protein Lalb_Chr19g0138761 [Lupinus albus]